MEITTTGQMKSTSKLFLTSTQSESWENSQGYETYWCISSILKEIIFRINHSTRTVLQESIIEPAKEQCLRIVFLNSDPTQYYHKHKHNSLNWTIYWSKLPVGHELNCLELKYLKHIRTNRIFHMSTVIYLKHLKRPQFHVDTALIQVAIPSFLFNWNLFGLPVWIFL